MTSIKASIYLVKQMFERIFINCIVVLRLEQFWYCIWMHDAKKPTLINLWSSSFQKYNATVTHFKSKLKFAIPVELCRRHILHHLNWIHLFDPVWWRNIKVSLWNAFTSLRPQCTQIVHAENGFIFWHKESDDFERAHLLFFLKNFRCILWKQYLRKYIGINMAFILFQSNINVRTGFSK